MTEHSRLELIMNWFGLDSDKTKDGMLVSNSFLESSHEERSDIVRAIIHNRSLDHLGSILGSGWDVNEILRIPKHYKYASWDFSGPETLVHQYSLRTALGEAARQRWTEGLQMLLGAGAKCKTTDTSSGILALALQSPKCQPEIIHLLLKHGADPNDHDDESKHIPLLLAVHCVQAVSITKLLLEHGADPKVIGRKESGHNECPLYAALGSEAHDINPLLKTLLHFGADVNSFTNGYTPLLYSLEVDPHIFHLEQLDLFFLYGCNINKSDAMGDTVLRHAITDKIHSNTIRWLIRHGLHPDLWTLSDVYYKDYFSCSYLGSEKIFEHMETPLVLLQANMAVSHGTKTHFSKIEKIISAWVKDDTEDASEIRDIWMQLDELHWAELQRMQGSVRKSTFPKYLTHQMDDLQEFSDSSLHAYPQDNQKYQIEWQDVLDQIHTVLEFLSQPQSLQWYCRCCVRDNMVSLQPSVVKTLPVPAKMKRYILCHEI